MKTHNYITNLIWTGNQGKGTQNYKAYTRDHLMKVEGKKHDILGSSDPAFLGDRSRFNPEELFVSSIASCHMLWYLHLCSVNKIIVQEYSDTPHGVMEENKDGSGRFTKVTLHPNITIKSEANLDLAHQLHIEAHKMCFIANSCNFDIYIEPEISLKI